MNVRPAKLSDVEQIMKIWNPYIKNSLVTFNSSEKTKEDICDLIEVRRKKGHEFWIASKNDKIIGFASYDQLRAGVGYRYSMEHTIIVSAEAKGLGVGKKLMDILKQVEDVRIFVHIAQLLLCTKANFALLIKRLFCLMLII